jgi:hypothetical protein
VKRNVADDPPPFLGSWNRIYLVVILYLVTLITLFWFFEKAWA